MKRCFLFILLRYYSSALIVSSNIHIEQLHLKEAHFELVTMSWELPGIPNRNLGFALDS